MVDILPQLIVNALITGSIYALASAGLALAYGLHRILNFAHGHFMMVGAYVFLWGTTYLGFSTIPSILIVLAFSFVFSQLFLKIFIVPFFQYSTLLPFVTTLALSIILESVISMTFGVNVRSLGGGNYIESIQIGSVFITGLQIWIIIIAIVTLSSLAIVVHATALGRRMRAISQDSFAAQALGINNFAVMRGVFFYITLVASLAGILVGFETNLSPTMGSAYTIKAFAAMLLGGLGNIWGAIFGSYLLGLIENLSIGLDFGGYSIPAGYKDAFAFFTILILLLFRPQGLFARAGRQA